MIPGLKNKVIMKEFSLNQTMIGRKFEKKQKTYFKSKTQTLDLPEEKHLPTLVIEPSSDGEEIHDGLLESVANTFQLKSRSLSYANYESIDKGNLVTSDFLDDVAQSKLMKNYFRRRGKSVEIPKPCIHCILMEKFKYENDYFQSADDESFFKFPDIDLKFGEIDSSSSQSIEYNDKNKNVIINNDNNNINKNGDDDDNNNDYNNPTVALRNKTISSSSTTSEKLSHYLQVPEQKDIVNLNYKPRSQSIDQIIDYLSLDKHNLSVEFITNTNKPRAVSIDFNMPFTLKKSNKSLGVSERQNILNSNRAHNAENIHIHFKSTPDWSIDAQNRTHYWVDTNLSGDLCYLVDNLCEKSGAKKKCTSCKLIIHQLCIPQLEFPCRPTFREAGVRDYRDEKKKEDTLRHHWVHRKRQDGKCKQCGKSFQSKFAFNSKEIVAVQCSWCKSPYHNKSLCFATSLLTEECSRGQHYDSIIPPSWIIKMATKNNFKSSVRKSRSPDSVNRCTLPSESTFIPKLNNLDTISSISKLQNDDNISEHITMTKSISLQSTFGITNHIPFVIKPIPNNPPSKPLLVFLNPKSGGNAGVKLMRKFQWLLNPRQVFDITDRGPRFALELFGKVPNLRILVCGGDGTVGWVMSEIDTLNILPSPPIAILPLGTGNDLARATHWGSGYADEPLSKIISCVEEGQIKPLDRWNLASTPNQCTRSISKDELSMQNRETITEQNGPPVVSKLPLNVFNNYFSLGADAAAALEFHESREANPEKFNSRLKNKIFYAGIGGIDVLKRSWKDLSDYITLVCDGIDFTPRIKEMKPHLLLFLNIQRYSGGTLPWGNPSAGFGPQSFNDGKLEVVGLTAASLATLQVGGHADRICQCQHAVVTTTKTIPMQVDGEPCRLLPSEIQISHHGVAQIVLKPKRRISIPVLSDYDDDFNQELDQSLKLSVFVIPLIDYEDNVMNKQRILEAAKFYCMMTENVSSNLSTVRENILKMASDTCMLDKSFTFLDSATTERFFRITKDKEDIHFLMDICLEDLYVLDPKLPSSLSPNESYTGDKGDFYSSADSINVEVNNDKIQANVSDNVFKEDFEEFKEKKYTKVDVTNNDLVEPIDSNNKSEVVHIRNDLENANNNENNGFDINEPVLKYMNIDILNNYFIESCKSTNVMNVQRYIFDGADILAVDSDGMSGLHHAVLNGNIGVVHYLMNDAPSNLLELKDCISGQTALHKAAATGQKSICSLLISAGASLLAKDNSNRTPSQLTDDLQLMQFLQKEEILMKIGNDPRKINI